MQDKFAWGHSRRYNDYPTFIKKKYGNRVQKISINVGFTCPNKDGTKGRGGCIYCNNSTFKPGYCNPVASISEQVKTGVDFFSSKYPEMEYMAYFQSYTNTYAPVDDLRKMYVEALKHPKVVGLIIGTRPDCINNEILEMLHEITIEYPVAVEFGVESTKNTTLNEINRCHTWEESVEAINNCAAYNIEVGAHLILGLPNENREDMLEHAKKMSQLPITTIKIHQLQVTTNTKLAQLYKANPNYIKPFTFESYLDLIVDFLEILNPRIIVERFVSTSPIEKLIAPKWNKMKNFEMVAKIEKELALRETYQGKLFKN